jgi:glutamate 5-kinase
MAGGAGSSIGRGGMITKILAAGVRRLRRVHRDRLGPRARRTAAPGAGESIGTLLVAQTQKKQARKQWMADHLQLRGAVVVDDGAPWQGARRRQEPAAHWHDGVEGDFSRGDVIAVRSARLAPKLPAGWPTIPVPRPA